MEIEKLAVLFTGIVERLGFAAMVAAYFMFKDYKLEQRRTEASEKMAASMAVLANEISKEA